MKLWNLLHGVPLAGEHFTEDMEISSLSYDTRTLEPGALFVALPGARTDGARFIREALEKGAAAVLCETPPEGEGPWLATPDARRALALASANWFGHPARKLTLVGVTGTNGKTTTTCLIKDLLERVLGTKAGLIGTIENQIGSLRLPAHRTTPESYEVQQLLRQMADAGCTHVVMEVSSHALVQHRVEGLTFAAGVFTNLTQDHLDYHHTMEEYRDAKGLLFRQCETAVLNLDDEAGRWYRERLSCPVFTYSENKDAADLTAKNIRLFPGHVEFEAVSRQDIQRIHLPIPGGFTIYNALAAASCGLCLGLELGEIAAALRCARGVKGRVEVVPTPTAYTVLIDYAHTPDGLENVLQSVKGFCKGRVIVVFGCGGDRDPMKRPIMGKIATELADIAVITSDNPRTEEPMAIIQDILAGVDSGKKNYKVMENRPKAIAYAMDIGEKHDIIILAGKGHETYQEIQGVKHHLDEREVVAAYLEEKRN